MRSWPCCVAGRADEIKVVTSGGFTAAYLELVPQYEAATHNKLVTEFGPSMGTTHNAIPIRLERGEAIDVVIMAAPALDGLLKQGKVCAGSRLDLVQSLIGMAVKGQALSKQSWGTGSIFGEPSKSAHELDEDGPPFGCPEAKTPGLLFHQ